MASEMKKMVRMEKKVVKKMEKINGGKKWREKSGERKNKEK